MNTPGYESLAEVLTRAYDQAAKGKGVERHANNRPFTEQPMQPISTLLGTNAGLLYQAMKKIQESTRMDPEAATRELLGAINYVAGAIIWQEARKDVPLPFSRSEKLKQEWEKEQVMDNLIAQVAAAPGPLGSWVCGHGAHYNASLPATAIALGEPCLDCGAKSPPP